MSNKVEFSIKITDDGSFKHVEADAEQLGKALNNVKQEAEKLNSEVINWTQTAQAVDAFQQTIDSLRGVMTGLTQTYQQQLVAETQLSTVMKQRMGVTDAEVKSIKDLCAAQQELGVIGDEVQISGAQQMATFLNEKSSLDTLIPAMNNLLAQQNGLNATQQDAVSIGNMMGKAMQGQVDVLQRVGITFTDAQKSILKYGDESQRAAVLAEVIRDNVGDMNAELAATDAGQQKQLENTLGDIQERLGEIAQKAMPIVTIAANMVTVASGAMKAAASVRAMASAFDFAKAKAMILSLNEKMVATAQRLLAVSGYTAAAGTAALTVATIALYAALTMGISLVIEGLVALFYSLADSASDAADAEREAGDAASEAESARRREAATLQQVRSQMEIYINRLKNFNGTKEEEKKLVNELNDTYGTTMGYFSSVSEWYNALVQNSKAYCDQMVIEARTRMLADRIAQKEQENYDLRYDENGKARKYSTKRDTETVTDGMSYETGMPTMKYKKVEVAGTSDLDKANAKIKQNCAAIKNMKAQLEDAGKAASKIVMPVIGSPTRPEGGSGNGSGGGKTGGSKETTLIANAETYKELANNIKYYEEQLENTKPSEKETISRLVQNIAGLKEKQAAIKEVLDAAGRPTELNTLENIDKEIQYQQGLRSKATAENIGGIDKEIRRLNGLKRALEDSGHASVGADQILTYEELEAEIGYYEGKLRTASETERVEIQKQILSLQNLKKEWDGVLASVGAPDESKVNTIEELEAAITYYSNLQKKQSAEEVANTQEVINRLEGKKKALLDIASIPTMANELAELGKLGNAELKMELQLIGIEGIKGKIRGLQKMLDDTKNPLGKEQRQEVMKMMAAYEGYENVLKKQNVTISQTWGSIKGIGNSVESLTETLKGDGNAWEKVCGVMDGMLGLYEGIKGIVEIVQILTAVTTAHAAAKIAEAGSETTESGTLAANAAAAATAAATTTAANSIATAAWTALAAAEFMAAHAEIPFAGFGIASGFIAGMEAIVAACAIPKFANGAIAYGPTLGLFGEYAGASSNPEVVAPLSKLQDLLDTDSGGGMLAGKVKFEIDGRKLVGVLQKEDKMKNRT